MRIAVAVVLVFLAVLLAWMILGHGSDSQRTPLLAPSATGVEAKEPEPVSALETRPADTARKVELAKSAEALPPAAAVQGSMLSVRSSVGLALPFIEWQANEIDWLRVVLDHGRCEVGAIKLPCLVRAPGHVAGLASRAGEELVLEPDALLVLEASELRKCVSWIRPGDFGSETQEPDETRLSSGFRSAVDWGWLSDTRWALAVSTELVANTGHGPEDPVCAIVRWRDGRLADVRFRVKAGMRGTWTVPCENLAASSDLEVNFRRLGPKNVGPVQLRLWRIREIDPDSVVETHEWGSVSIRSLQSFSQSLTSPAHADSVRFHSVPQGMRLSLAARDETTSAYGRLVFVHNGSARILELRPAFEVTGHVTSSSPAVPVRAIDWHWQFREAAESVWGWRADARGLALPSDGSFHLPGPSMLLIRADASLDPPAHLQLNIEAAGFEPFEKLFETNGATRFDCGEIVLSRKPGEIVLAPGHGLSPRAFVEAELRIQAAPEVWWRLRHAALMPDESLEVSLFRSKTQPELCGTRDGPRVFPDTPSESILVHLHFEHSDPPWAFERSSDGRYVAVPRRDFEAEAECRAMPSEGKSWFVGWEWHGLWDTCDQVPAYDLGQKVRLHFSMPAEGATLFWSASGNPPRAGNEPGGTASTEALAGKLVLQ